MKSARKKIALLRLSFITITRDPKDRSVLLVTFNPNRD